MCSFRIAVSHSDKKNYSLYSPRAYHKLTTPLLSLHVVNYLPGPMFVRGLDSRRVCPKAIFFFLPRSKADV